MWDTIFAALTPALRESLQTVRLVSVQDGVAVLEAGPKAEWLQTRTPRALKQALRLERPDITEIRFVADYTPDEITGGILSGESV